MRLHYICIIDVIHSRRLLENTQNLLWSWTTSRSQADGPTVNPSHRPPRLALLANCAGRHRRALKHEDRK